MKIISPALRKTADVARGTFGALSRADSRLVLVDAALSLTVTATAFTAFLVTETGAAILDEIHRRQRIRLPRPESPSLRGTPTPGELADACAAIPRKLLERLRKAGIEGDSVEIYGHTVNISTENGTTYLNNIGYIPLGGEPLIDWDAVAEP